MGIVGGRGPAYPPCIMRDAAHKRQRVEERTNSLERPLNGYVEIDELRDNALVGSAHDDTNQQNFHVR